MARHLLIWKKTVAVLLSSPTKIAFYLVKLWKGTYINFQRLKGLRKFLFLDLSQIQYVLTVKPFKLTPPMCQNKKLWILVVS